MNEPPTLKSALIAIPPAQIALFKSIVESYDNLATLRTEDPRRHYMRMYFAADQAGEVECLLAALAGRFEITRLK
jgi:hypothetical protein